MKSLLRWGVVGARESDNPVQVKRARQPPMSTEVHGRFEINATEKEGDLSEKDTKLSNLISSGTIM